MKPPWILSSSSVLDEKSNLVCNCKVTISKWRRAEDGMRMAREEKTHRRPYFIDQVAGVGSAWVTGIPLFGSGAAYRLAPAGKRITAHRAVTLGSRRESCAERSSRHLVAWTGVGFW